MPARSPLQVVAFDGFPGGLQLDSAASDLSTEQLQVAKNLVYTQRGEPRHVGGLTQQDTLRFVYLTKHANRLIGIATNGNVYYSDANDATNFTLLGSAIVKATYTTSAEYVLGIETVYITSTGEYLYITNGSTAGGTDAIRIGISTATQTTVATFIKARHLLYQHDRMFAANNDDNPNRIFFSDIGDVETWGASSWIDVDPDADDEITGIVPYGDDILIFKNRSIWQLVGRTEASFSLYRLDPSKGSPSRRSIANVQGKVVFFDPNTGIWQFDGSGFEQISYPIQEWFRDQVLATSSPEFFHSWAFAYKDRYYLCIRHAWDQFADTDGGTLIWDAQTKAWSIADFRFEDGAYIWADNDSEPYLSSNSKLFKLDRTVVTDSEATSRAMTFTTGWVRLGGGAAVGRVKRVEVLVEGSNGDSVTVDMFADWDLDAAYLSRTETIVGDATADFHEVVLRGWGTKKRAAAFRITTAVAQTRIPRIIVYYTTNADLLSEHAI